MHSTKTFGLLVSLGAAISLAACAPTHTHTRYGTHHTTVHLGKSGSKRHW